MTTLTSRGVALVERDRLEQVLGAEHPDTVAVRENLLRLRGLMK